MNFNITEEQEAHPADVKENFSTLEAELKTYIKQVVCIWVFLFFFMSGFVFS